MHTRGKQVTPVLKKRSTNYGCKDNDFSDFSNNSLISSKRASKEIYYKQDLKPENGNEVNSRNQLVGGHNKKSGT